MVTNTEKVNIQIPFVYEAEIRIYLLVIVSFLLGILCCKITSFFKHIFELPAKLKNFILRKKTNIIALISIINIFFLFINNKSIAKNNKSIFVNKNNRQALSNQKNKNSGIFTKKITKQETTNKQNLFINKKDKIYQEKKPLPIKDNSIIYSKIKDKTDRKDLKNLMSLIKAKNKNKKLYDIATEFAMVYENKLYTINKKTKTIKNKTLSTNITSKISFDDNYLYFITANNNLYFLNRENFNIDFIYYETAETTIINNLAPIIYGDYIVSIFNGNKLVVLDKKNNSIITEKFLQKNRIINENDVVIIDNSIKIGDTTINF